MTLDEVRQKYPAYRDVEDEPLANALYEKFYAGKLPREEFNKQIGFDPQARQPGWLSTLGHGMLRGFMGQASAGAQAEAAEMGQPEMQESIPSGEEATKIMEREVTGKLPVKRGFGGRVVHGIGEVMGSPGSYMGGRLPLQIGSGVASAVGGEAAATLFKDTRLETPARVVGSFATGTGVGIAAMERQLGQATAKLPTRMNYKERASAGYKQLEQSQTQLSPEGTSVLAGEILDYLYKTNHRPHIPDHKPVFDVLEKDLMGIGRAAARAEQGVAQRGEAAVAALTSASTEAEINQAIRLASATAGKTTSVGEIDTVRRVLSGLSASPNPATREAAGHAIDAIDHFLANVPERFVISGNPKADAALLRQSQEFWKTQKQLEEVEKATTRAQRRAGSTGTGHNNINTARQELRKIIDSEKRSRSMPQEVKDKIDQIVEGTWASNAARMASKHAPSGPVSAMTTGAAFFGAGPWAAAGVAGGAWLAKYAGQYLTDRQIRELQQLIQGGTSLGRPIMREISPLMEQARLTPAEMAGRALMTGPLGPGGP